MTIVLQYKCDIFMTVIFVNLEFLGVGAVGKFITILKR